MRSTVVSGEMLGSDWIRFLSFSQCELGLVWISSDNFVAVLWCFAILREGMWMVACALGTNPQFCSLIPIGNVWGITILPRMSHGTHGCYICALVMVDAFAC